MKREFYVSPERYKQIKEGVDRNESRDSKTYDYSMQSDKLQSTKRVLVSKKETVFGTEGEIEDVNLYGNQNELQERYSGKL